MLENHAFILELYCGKRCLPSPLPGGVKCGVPSPMNGGLSPDPSENGLRLEFYGAVFFC
jgi:hypothetical protein